MTLLAVLEGPIGMVGVDDSLRRFKVAIRASGGEPLIDASPMAILATGDPMGAF